MPHICISELGQHWFRYWLVACSVPSHYLNQNWLIVNWTLRNKLQWNSNQNTKLFIHENAFENVVCKMAAILSRGEELTHWPPGRYDRIFRSMIFKLIVQDSTLGTHIRIQQNLSNETSTLVQVMAWCHQAPSHYLSQCWPRSMSPYDHNELRSQCYYNIGGG